MTNVLVVVWRESFEAVLIVGILFNFLMHSKDNQILRKKALQYMWSGVGLGILFSGIMAYAINSVQTELQGQYLDYFQNGLLLVAAVLMTHMCLWMKVHGRKIKGELEGDLKENLKKSNHWGVLILSMLAVSREGVETVIFLYGMSFEAISGGKIGELSLYALAGLGLALATWVVFQKTMSFLGQKIFFKITSLFLLLTAGNLILTLTRNLIQSEILPTLKDVVWDTSFVLDERSVIGEVISAITGYESTPALITVLVALIFWSTVIVMNKVIDQKSLKPKN